MFSSYYPANLHLQLYIIIFLYLSALEAIYINISKTDFASLLNVNNLVLSLFNCRAKSFTQLRISGGDKLVVCVVYNEWNCFVDV
jgi:hypothetical protein